MSICKDTVTVLSLSVWCHFVLLQVRAIVHYITIIEPLTIVPYVRLPIDASGCSSESLVFCRVEMLRFRDANILLTVGRVACTDQWECIMVTYLHMCYHVGSYQVCTRPGIEHF